MSTISKRYQRLSDRVREEERGDVPGWVLVTLMTAGLATPDPNRGNMPRSRSDTAPDDNLSAWTSCSFACSKRRSQISAG